MSEIDRVHSSCKNCIFAIYNENTQIDCAADQLTKFRENDVEIVEAYDEEATKNEFFIINGKICRMARSESWKNKQSTQNITKLFELASRETNIKYHLIININSDFKQLKKCIKSIQNQKVQPEMVTFIRNLDCKIHAIELVELLRESKFKWKVENIGEWVDYNRSIDIAVKNSNATFYAVFNSDTVLDKTLFYSLNRKINNLAAFVVTQPDAKCSGWLALKDFHVLSRGNTGGQTLYEYAKEQGIPCPKTYELIH